MITTPKLNGHDSTDHINAFLEAAAERQAFTYAQMMATAAQNAAVDDGLNAQMAAYHSSYFAGQTSRYLPQPNGINPLGSGSDSHYSSERAYFLMTERARQDDRDNVVFGQAVNRLTANVFLEPYELDVTTPDDGLNKDLKSGFCDEGGFGVTPEWCDFENERTFHEMAELAFRATVVDGDIFSLYTNSGIQIAENHRVRNPALNRRNEVRNGSGVIHGVEMKKNRRVAFYMMPDDVSPAAMIGRRTQLRRVPVRDRNGNRQAIQLYQAKRFTQRRGVTACAPIVFTNRYHDDLQFAALVNAKRASFFAIIHEFELGMNAQGGQNRGGQTGERTTETRSDGSTSTKETGSPGARYVGDPGEKIKGFSPDIPSPRFFDHAKMLIALTGINLDLPPMVMMLDASKGNFNAFRGVWQQAVARMSQMQRYMIRAFHRPGYRYYVRQRAKNEPALRSALQRLGRDAFSHLWTPPAWPYLQPVQDAGAAALRLQENLESHFSHARSRQRDWNELAPEIVHGRALLIEHAIAQSLRLNQLIENVTGTAGDVNWRDLAYGNRGGVRVNLTGALEPSEPANDEKGTDDE